MRGATASLSAVAILLQIASVSAFLPSSRFFREIGFVANDFHPVFTRSAIVYAGTLSTSSTTIPPNLKILILPGFGNDSIDYYMSGSLVDSLQEQGWPRDSIDVLRVARSDWLQVFWKGALDLKFWTAEADPTRAAFRWYLERISQQIQELCDGDHEDCRVILVGHSAGGWLGRAALGFGSRQNDGDGTVNDSMPVGPPINLDKVLGLVSLGAPHLPPPPGIMDMTRGALRITNEQFPGAYHKPNDGIFYITAIGLSVQGEEQERRSPLEPTTVKGFAYNSYEAVCGNGTTIGDGVVPYSAAHLDGAVQLDLKGVLHSINAPDNWYGSSQVIDRWHEPMLQELKASKKLSTNSNNIYTKNIIDRISTAFEKFKIL
ncbi:PGAP1-like protein [Nitzschia inconspicua]|uniref:PGAP1-like protein n=1 Tax=Nitzschia inconspicua TaxID=303405 RepID=A0A9K3PCC7_9STRA|nr:PGAP1-like protein [Nitzschia inconspicua]